MSESKTYAGIPDSLGQVDKARAVLIPVPYDGTSTWGKGADLGPEAFLDASENMELYDIETDSEVYLEGVFLDDPISENASPESMTAAVKARVAARIKQGKFVTLFGGEHSISIGSIQAHAEAFDNVTVLQIDAHADLRPDYMGSECNHACALHWAAKNTNLIQVGIRSMDISEKEHMNFEQTYFAHDIAADKENVWMRRLSTQLTKKVYVTIDLDGFDSALVPSTGTPEPGGMDWYSVLKLLRLVSQKSEIVGFDIVELKPNKIDKSSDFLAAKLYYKLLTYCLLK
jgi:agmatinase